MVHCKLLALDLLQSLNLRLDPCRDFFELLRLFGLKLLKLFHGSLLFGFRAAGLRLADALLGFLHPSLHLLRCRHDLLQGRNAKNLFPIHQ